MADFPLAQGTEALFGTYWSVTVRDHVIYESRLELARLLLTDFDPSVDRIVAQPFLPKAEVDGMIRKHIPDYLLFTKQAPMVVEWTGTPAGAWRASS